MIELSRSKLVSIYLKEQDIFSVHSVLEDDIYGIELDMEVKADELVITSIKGRWIRQENHYCALALPVLEEMVGWRIDRNFFRKARKFAGRKACIQFADLIIECADAIMDVVRERGQLISEKGTGEEKKTEKYPPEDERIMVTTPKGDEERTIAASEKKDEMDGYMEVDVEMGSTIIDLHVHSFPQSPCSNASVDEMIETAKAIGLNGICLTDHNFMWNEEDLIKLREKHGFLILSGSEVTTDQGDVLVFGFKGKIDHFIKIEDLHKLVKSSGGVMIVAHPFRGFLTFSADELGLNPREASQRKVFKYVDAVEVLNCKVSQRENNMAASVADILDMPKTGGSDAHNVSEVGLFATRFHRRIRSEAELVEALLSRAYGPIAYRKSGG